MILVAEGRILCGRREYIINPQPNAPAQSALMLLKMALAGLTLAQNGTLSGGHSRQHKESQR